MAHDGHMRAPCIGYMYRLDSHTHISMLGTLAQIRLARQNKRFHATRTTCMCAVNARDVVLARCSMTASHPDVRASFSVVVALV